MIGTRILKMYLEIADIIEVKVGTRHLEIDILLFNMRQKNNFSVTGGNFDLTLTTNFRYCRLGDLNLEPATLCACAGGEQQTIIKIVIHFL